MTENESTERMAKDNQYCVYVQVIFQGCKLHIDNIGIDSSQNRRLEF